MKQSVADRLRMLPTKEIEIRLQGGEKEPWVRVWNVDHTLL